ncbi:MAG: type IV pilin-like G/H family protein [Phormidium sp.]
MKSALKIKFLLYLSQPNHNQGFTKLGVLARLLICGTAVTALSFPFYTRNLHFLHLECGSANPRNLLYRSSCWRMPEAKSYVSAVNKSQGEYYTENGQFVTSSDDAAWSSLGVGIRTQTTNYMYRIRSLYPSNGPFQKKDGQMIIPEQPKQGKDYVMVIAQPLSPALKSYVGIVRLVEKSGNDKTTESIICESERGGVVQSNVIPPPFPHRDIQCPEGFGRIY